MIVTLDPASAVPAYEQVRAQVTDLVAAGTLAPGTPLPAVRTLAAELGISPGTVAKAYRLLDAAGVTTAHRGLGTLVAAGSTAPADSLAAVRTAAAAYARTARSHGVDPATAATVVAEALRA